MLETRSAEVLSTLSIDPRAHVSAVQVEISVCANPTTTL